MDSPPVYVKDFDEKKAINASHNARVAAGLYGVTLVIAVFMYFRHSRRDSNRLGRHQRLNSPSIGLDDSPSFNVPLVSTESHQTGSNLSNLSDDSTTGLTSVRKRGGGGGGESTALSTL